MSQRRRRDTEDNQPTDTDADEEVKLEIYDEKEYGHIGDEERREARRNTR